MLARDMHEVGELADSYGYGDGSTSQADRDIVGVRARPSPSARRAGPAQDFRCARTWCWSARCILDAYGKRTVKNAAGAEIPKSTVGQQVGFTGRSHDVETGLIYFRTRYHSPVLGRFINRMPWWSMGGTSTFAYDLNSIHPSMRGLVRSSLSAGAGSYLQDRYNLYDFLRASPSNWLEPFSTVTRTGGTEVGAAGGTVTLQGGVQGQVKVFTDVSGETPTTRFQGFIQLSLTANKSCDDCRWLQFVYRTHPDTAGAEDPGSYAGSGAFYKYGEGARHVDSSHPTDPFYDAKGMSNRTATESSLFDGPSVDKDGREKVIFDAYLICTGVVKYHVHWELGYEGGQRKYGNVSGEPTAELPPWARGDNLPGEAYSRRNRETGELSNPQPPYANPVAVENRGPRP